MRPGAAPRLDDLRLPLPKADGAVLQLVALALLEESRCVRLRIALEARECLLLYLLMTLEALAVLGAKGIDPELPAQLLVASAR